VRITIRNVTENTGQDALKATGEAKMKFGGKEYTTNIGLLLAKEQIYESGKSYTEGSITIPISEISNSKHSSSPITVSGSFWHFKSDGSGATPLTYPLIPIPIKYTNIVLPFIKK
jgi:hypothetical protein